MVCTRVLWTKTNMLKICCSRKKCVVVRLNKYVNVSMEETYHEFLSSFTNIISNNIYSEKDTTIKLFSPLLKNDKIVFLAADKECYTVILNKSDYIRKVSNIIEEGM